MRKVMQEDLLGCGIACVACVCKVDYNTAKRKYFVNGKNAKAKGFYCRDIVGALKRAGKSYSYKYRKGKEECKLGTIVFVKKSKRRPVGHYLVKTSKGWMDPWRNYPSLKKVRAGFRKSLRERVIYAIIPED